MEFAWYTVITFAGQELKVKSLIEAMIEHEPDGKDLFGRVEVPYIREKIIKKSVKGKQTTKEEIRIIFPAYAFVQIVQNEGKLNERARHLVLNIQGVTKFLTIGNKIEAVPDEEIAKILPDLSGVGETDVAVEVISIREGDKIRIKGEVFNDYTGVVAEVQKDRGKLKAMVEIFGRSIPVELNFADVEVL
ncbi:transcription termination/antitermination protein NusG [Fibrobacterales bacterium]|nr:transcription termination/antitermination protein NusG [Fibrobacterales bacterium]